MAFWKNEPATRHISTITLQEYETLINKINNLLKKWRDHESNLLINSQQLFEKQANIRAQLNGLLTKKEQSPANSALNDDIEKLSQALEAKRKENTTNSQFLEDAQQNIAKLETDLKNANACLEAFKECQKNNNNRK